MKGFFKMFSRAKTTEANVSAYEIREAVKQNEIASAGLVQTLNELLEATNNATARRGLKHHGSGKRQDH